MASRHALAHPGQALATFLDNTPMHLLIPSALADTPALAQALDGLALPHLQRLQALLQPAGQRVAEPDSPSMPHELALAQALGLPGAPGHLPWAAHETQTWGTPCAWLRPCHWQVGTDRILMGDPDALALAAPEAEALCAAMAPYFAEDGITLHCTRPGAWLACGEVFHDLPTAALERVVGRSIDAWLPDAATPQGATLRRLQNEMQMLLYTHPLNDARAARGLAPVNSFWLTGAGVLAQALPARPEVVVEPRLAAAALRQDGAAWAAAWRAVDADAVARLATRQAGGQPVRLTLCGERVALDFEPGARGLFTRMRHVFGPKPLSDLLKQL